MSDPPSAYSYAGEELQLFAQAKNWKRYLFRTIAPYLGEDVLEVGAGIGGTTRMLCRRKHRAWTCLEPDDRLLCELKRSFAESPPPSACAAALGTLATFSPDARYDTLLYIDVLEHIEDDAAEMQRAAGTLAPGGRVIVLSPAHQFLYTSFDKALGHFRRYSRLTLHAAMPPALRQERLIYLDSVGMLASFANRLFLHSARSTPRQIAAWDRGMVPLSRVLDPLLLRSVGKSVLGVYRKSVS